MANIFRRRAPRSGAATDAAQGSVVREFVQESFVARTFVRRAVVQATYATQMFVLCIIGNRTLLQRTLVKGTSALPGAGLRLAALCLSLVSAACGNEAPPKPSAAQVDSAALAAKASNVISPDTAGRTLASAAGATAYHVDDVAGANGIISGSVHLLGVLPLDTMVVPDRDSTGCRAFQDVTMPTARGARSAKQDSTEHDVGNAIVWLVGVTHGPRDVLPRRVNLVLDDCHLEPRVMVAPVGATINMTNRDDMLSQLHFVDHGRGAAPRATIGFTDPGQVVPSEVPLGKPGLVEITDEKHPWVRGFIAVAPHPFVAVTGADGEFAFEGVPAGEYTLVVWHERLGGRVAPVRVQAGVTTAVGVKY